MADSELIRYVGTASSFRWPEYGIDVSQYPEDDSMEEVAPDVADFLVTEYNGGDEFEYYNGNARVATGLLIVDGLDIAPETVDMDSVATDELSNVHLPAPEATACFRCDSNRQRAVTIG